MEFQEGHKTTAWHLDEDAAKRCTYPAVKVRVDTRIGYKTVPIRVLAGVPDPHRHALQCLYGHLHLISVNYSRHDVDWALGAIAHAIVKHAIIRRSLITKPHEITPVGNVLQKAIELEAALRGIGIKGEDADLGIDDQYYPTNGTQPHG